MPEIFLDLITLGMGNTRSKRKDRLGRTKEGNSSAVGGNRDAKRSAEVQECYDFSLEIRERYAEDEELKILRRTIKYNPEVFILNNLMMSVQFFENYDEEIINIRKTLVSPRETELNARLPPQKHILIPDVLQEHVARRVDFTYMEPTFKHTIELLQPIRIYVAFDNIEVTEHSYTSPYCSVSETITYSMQLKPSPSHKGYVLLQRLDVNPPKKVVSADDLDLGSMANGTGEDIYSDGDSMYGNKSNQSGASGSTRMDKNPRDLNDDESIYEDHRYGSPGNVFDDPSTNRDTDENTHDPSTDVSCDVRSLARKDIGVRRGGMRNAYRQHGRPKSLHLINESPAGSTSSGYRSGNYMDSDSDYSYAHTVYNSPKTSKNSVADGSTVLSYEIPPHCFRKIEYSPDGRIYDARRERRQKLNSKEQQIKQAHKSRNYDVWYLNSTKFMKHFCHLFTDQLAEPMGFKPDIDSHAQGAVIYRDKVEVLEGTMSTKVEQFEIVPCVCSEWPECAQEWVDRPRTTWPHYNVIEKVKEFGCHMIPEEPLSDKPSDKYQDLKWQLIFPAAERFLETCLTYPQVRVYLIALMLHKTFIRPMDSIFGLTVSHIKNRLFWLVEEDDRPSKWAENRTGESFLKLLNSLYRSISQDEPNLPDYFVRDKNLFQEKSCLLRTQKQLKRIIENPVMYVFHAMENIRHSRRFFPRLDYEELLKILTAADTVTLVNPALAPQVSRPLTRPNIVDQDYDHVAGFWDNTRQKKDETKVHPKRPATNRSLIKPRKADDQVVEIPIRCGSMDHRRLSCILDFFIRHFIKMAECCHNYRALPQKMAYIDQAERLSVLLSEHDSHKDDAKTYLAKLCSLKKRVTNSRSRDDPPETPRRNPDRPVFTRPLKNRYQSSDYSFQEQFVKIPEAGETKEYELESARTSVYNLGVSGPNVNRLVTSAVIHEEDSENSDNVELRSSKNVTIEDKEALSSERAARVVSLSDTQQESFLTETTYI